MAVLEVSPARKVEMASVTGRSEVVAERLFWSDSIRTCSGNMEAPRSEGRPIVTVTSLPEASVPSAETVVSDVKSCFGRTVMTTSRKMERFKPYAPWTRTMLRSIWSPAYFTLRGTMPSSVPFRLISSARVVSSVRSTPLS